MDLFTAVMLGILQGIFEWLPVSSEAVITIVLAGIGDASAVDAVNTAIWLHTGTMCAALIYFRRDLTDLITDGVTGEARFIVLATALTAVVGGLIYVLGLEAIASYPRLFTALMAVALTATGLLRWYRPDRSRAADSVSSSDAVLTGVLQGLAILPGVSRSGSTTFALLYRDFSAADAFRLSFLLSIPAVFIANIGMNLFSGFVITPPLVLSAAVAGVVGYASIGAVLRIADSARVSYICFGLAAITLATLLI